MNQYHCNQHIAYNTDMLWLNEKLRYLNLSSQDPLNFNKHLLSILPITDTLGRIKSNIISVLEKKNSSKHISNQQVQIKPQSRITSKAIYHSSVHPYLRIPVQRKSNVI